MTNPVRHLRLAALAAVLAVAPATATQANPLSFLPFASAQENPWPNQNNTLAYAPDNEALEQVEEAPAAFELPAHLKRQIVNYTTNEAPGTIIIDTGNTYLYLVLGQGRAMRYGIGVGREGFTWSGTKTVARKAEWPDWRPPAEMIQRQPYLPRFIAGGTQNPLGARAMYLGSSMYRIHGTNAPQTIGKRVSSGCIRMTNEDVTDLYARVELGAKVVVLPVTAAKRNPARVSETKPQPQPAVVAQAHPELTGPYVIRASGLY